MACNMFSDALHHCLVVVAVTHIVVVVKVVVAAAEEEEEGLFTKHNITKQNNITIHTAGCQKRRLPI